MNSLLKSSGTQLPTPPTSRGSTIDNFQPIIENLEIDEKTNDDRKLDANIRNENAPFRLQDKNSDFLRTLTDIEEETNLSLFELPIPLGSPDSESPNLAAETSLSLEAALATNAVAQADMSGRKDQDQILNKRSQTDLVSIEPMVTGRPLKETVVQASSEDNFPTKPSKASPSETAAPNSGLPIDASQTKTSSGIPISGTPSNDPLHTLIKQQGITLEGSPGTGLETDIASETSAKLSPTSASASITQSPLLYPAATPDTVAIETPTMLLDDTQKVVPERTSPLGLSNHTHSATVAKSVPTHFIITPSSMEHPAVQTVAKTLAQVQETQSGISVRLNPPEMGRVFVDFQFNADRSVTAVIRSEVPETAVLLKHHADFLQDALKDSGFNSVTLSFEQNDQSKNKGFNFDQKEKPPMSYQSTSSGGEDQSDTSETIHRHQTPSNSAIDLKL